MKIIPAIDIIDGQCVRLEQGNYTLKKVYNENPVEVAKQFEANGIRHLHLVDLDGAKSNKIVNWRVLNSIANSTNLNIDFGGGIKSENDLKIAFENGAKQVTAGSIAVKNKELVLSWIDRFGADKLILGADVLENKIAIQGWKEQTQIDIFDFIGNYQEGGIQNIICTDISKDGMLTGCSIDLYQKILERFPNIKLMASGGITSIRELDLLKDINIKSAIIGKAIYENKITLKELQAYVN